MAPQVGLEPTTLRLTAGCSAIELLRSVVTCETPSEEQPNHITHGLCGKAVSSSRLYPTNVLRSRFRVIEVTAKSTP
jgi:hypothetical protein